ncbi:phage holin family protein [Chitinivorax sp. B]|uniref:phage holin family protein n=1 Tax=Chitinivorax sp. B TaxID=2502235 RepID=UPI0010F446D5|nr:phage holin family protein [Chitinivorax sp. B]
MLELLNAALCALACGRLLLYTRRSVHRPWASVLAYGLSVALAAQVVMPLWGVPVVTGWPQLLINSLLCLAILAVGGNVVDLFRPADADQHSGLLRLLRKETWI